MSGQDEIMDQDALVRLSNDELVKLINESKHSLAHGIPVLIVPSNDGKLTAVAVAGFHAALVAKQDDARVVLRETEQAIVKQSFTEIRGWLSAVAGLVASVTYQAGFNPPGGVWGADDEARGQVAGTPILLHKSPSRYYAFCCGNVLAFASSLYMIAGLGFLAVRRVPRRHEAETLLLVAWLDAVSLLVAYGVGSSASRPLAAFIAAVLVFVMVITTTRLILRVLSFRRRRRPKSLRYPSNARPQP